ncbi:hypothetical protein BJX66DRAFT_291120 [Aspergillus keveii]|uniref:Secreted protein n=1 Tax=Aspergillus keveii TaxID=714993 RepID=A0ABR4GNB8_9EURO
MCFAAWPVSLPMSVSDLPRRHSRWLSRMAFYVASLTVLGTVHGRHSLQHNKCLSPTATPGSPLCSFQTPTQACRRQAGLLDLGAAILRDHWDGGSCQGSAQSPAYQVQGAIRPHSGSLPYPRCCFREAVIHQAKYPRKKYQGLAERAN